VDMKAHFVLCSVLLLALRHTQAQNQQPQLANPLINYPAFLRNAEQVESIRNSRRLTEAEFMGMMSEPGVVLLDARSAAKFKMRHLKGAINLTLPDFTATELKKIIPRQNTKVLIYCNNNFAGSPVAFAEKRASASLNISTFVTLHTYGYTNVYELGPLLDVKTAKLPFQGDEVSN